MIDTIVLTLSSDQYRILNPGAFSPSAFWASKAGSWASLRQGYAGHAHGIKSKQNPSKHDLKRGIYKPRLTLSSIFVSRTKQDVMLKIELSLPKLFFGNNFEELQYKDMRPCIKKLMGALQSMGVEVAYAALENAPVAAIHYSKNIHLTDGSTPYHYINKIRQANIKLSLDVNQTDYRNDGYSYRWHCNSYELIFYDKIRDLEMAHVSSKRVLEKDSALQMHLFEKFKVRKRFEILRMEVRLNKRQKIKQLLSKLDITTDCTLKKLCKPAIAKKVLLHYLDELERARPPLLDYQPHDDKELLSTLLVNNPGLAPKRIAQMYGLKKMLEVFTLRELRMRLGKNKRGWQKFISEAKQVRMPMRDHAFDCIRKCIEKFKNIMLNKFEK